MTPRLETARLILREPEPADLDGYAELFGDPEVMRWIGDGVPLPRAQVAERIERMLAHWRRYDTGLFTVLDREGEFVGRVGLLLWDAESWVSAMRAEPRGKTELEIGWSIVRARWDHGYATEAAVAVRDWITKERGVRRLISLIASGNRASVRVAEKIGERFERGGIPGFPFATDLYSLAR